MNEIKKIEDLLARFSRKPAPPGLRARALDAAAQKRDRSGLLSPALKRAALVSAAIAAAFLIIDAGLEGSQKKRLSSLIERQQNILQEWNDQSFIFKEFVAGDSNASWALLRLKTDRRAKEKEAQEARKKLLRRKIDEY